jgi:hypothetical protein
MRASTGKAVIDMETAMNSEKLVNDTLPGDRVGKRISANAAPIRNGARILA